MPISSSCADAPFEGRLSALPDSNVWFAATWMSARGGYATVGQRSLIGQLRTLGAYPQIGPKQIPVDRSTLT